MTRVERVVTSGVFALDGQEWEVENNVWLVGGSDSGEVVVIDAAHDHEPIVDALAGRSVAAIVLTHGHNDHINAGPALAEAVGGPLWLHPDDVALWHEVFPSADPDGALADGMRIGAGGVDLEVIHTPGHTPGGCCIYDASSGVLFSGDTCFAAVRAPPAGASATFPRSSGASGTACWSCRPTPLSIPGTGTPRPSARRPRTSRSGSPAATDSTPLIVDGNNVMGATADGWWRDRPAAVRRLLARLQCYRSRTGRAIVLVLDVPQPDLPPGDQGGVTVDYPAQRGRDAADHRIVEFLGGLDAGDVEVVTSDRALAEAARRQGATVIGAGSLLARLRERGCWDI